MKTLIDCTLLSRNKTGIENYTEQLVRSLLPMLEDSNYEVVFLFSYCKPQWFEDGRCIVYKGKSVAWMTVFWIPLQILKECPNIVLFTGFPPSLFVHLVKKIKSVKVVRVVYDAVLWLYPETLSVKNKIYYKPMETCGLRVYDGIATISQSSYDDIVRLFPNTKSKLMNIGTSLIHREATGEVKADLGSDAPFFLFVGTADKRKNIKVALQAFALFVEEFPSYKFFVVGRSAWGSQELQQAIAELNLSESVLLLGYVNDAQLNALYKKAKAFIFPSIYEGYGLPVVEAMYQGCPVIASNNSSIPEAAGGAALLVEDYMNRSAWLSEMMKLHLSKELCDNLTAKGYERVQGMSWEKVASSMMKLIVRVGKER